MSTARMRFSSVEFPGKPRRMMTFSMGVMNNTLQAVFNQNVLFCKHAPHLLAVPTLTASLAYSPVRIEHVAVAHNDLQDVDECQTNMPILTKDTLQIACIARTGSQACSARSSGTSSACF